MPQNRTLGRSARESKRLDSETDSADAVCIMSKGSTHPVPGPIAAPPSSDPEVVYRAGTQALKVRFLMWLSVACAVFAVTAAVNLFQTYGTRPADGGVLAPIGARIAWSGTVAALGLGFVFGMWLYGRYSIRELRWRRGQNQLLISTYRFIGSRTDALNVAEIAGATAKRDRFQGRDIFWAPTGLTVDAPWLAVRLRGRRWPLVLDLQGIVADPDRLRALLRSK
jgi:hypothetical protein